MAHDFVNFPELSNRQMEIYYFQSPHKQIKEDFSARVVKVIDGDTIKLRTNFRDFDFDMRLDFINAPEMNEQGGSESKAWLENQILNKQVDILINPLNSVEKFGRLLGKVVSGGIDMGELSMDTGHARIFGRESEGAIPKMSEFFR